MMNTSKSNPDQQQKIQVKICGITDPVELEMLNRTGVDYAGIWFNVPAGKYSLNKTRFVNLARTPVDRLKCIGVTTESDPEIIQDFVLESGISGVQLHGFQLPLEVSTIKRRLGEEVFLLKVLHIQHGKCLEKPLLREYQRCGADAFILDNFISRTQSGSTGQRIPADNVEMLVDIFGPNRVFVAGGLDAQGVSDLRLDFPFRGVDIDTGARIDSCIDSHLVMRIVQAAKPRVNSSPGKRKERSITHSLSVESYV
jgi:phosphoribosylanthranilate isomerase